MRIALELIAVNVQNPDIWYPDLSKIRTYKCLDFGCFFTQCRPRMDHFIAIKGSDMSKIWTVWNLDNDDMYVIRSSLDFGRLRYYIFCWESIGNFCMANIRDFWWNSNKVGQNDLELNRIRLCQIFQVQ